MPSLTRQVPNLRETGPIIEALRIAVSTPAEEALRNSQQPIPAPLSVNAMIDTGATGTVIQDGVAAQLGLQPVGVVSMTTPSSTDVQCSTYAVRLVFQINVVVEAVVIEAPRSEEHTSELQ